MVLVLFLLGIIFIIAMLVFLIMLSTIKIDIKKISINNTQTIDKKIEKDVLICIGLYLLGKWKILQIKLDDDKLRKSNVIKRIKKIDIKKLNKRVPLDKDTFKLISKIPIELETFKLDLNVGTIDIRFTTIINTIIIFFISILLPRLVKKYDSKKYNYQIKPIYTNENMVKLDFSCIINIKIVHIMNILYLVLRKGRVKENERTSNRKSYDYSYE